MTTEILPDGWVPNGKCLFGRMHQWLTKGDEIAGIDVALCTWCGLVNGTGRKIALEVGGGLFTTVEVTRAHFLPDDDGPDWGDDADRALLREADRLDPRGSA